MSLKKLIQSFTLYIFESYPGDPILLTCVVNGYYGRMREFGTCLSLECEPFEKLLTGCFVYRSFECDNFYGHLATQNRVFCQVNPPHGSFTQKINKLIAAESFDWKQIFFWCT